MTIITHIAAFVLGAIVYALVIKKNPVVQEDVAAAADAVNAKIKK